MKLREQRDSLSHDDRGFGLVEIVVSMFVLGLIAIAFLPLLIQGVQVTAKNRVIAAATQLVHDQLEQARAITTCNGLVAFGADTSQPSANFQITRTVENADDASADPCTITYPGVVKVTIDIVQAGEIETLTTATSLVLVKTAN